MISVFRKTLGTARKLINLSGAKEKYILSQQHLKNSYMLKAIKLSLERSKSVIILYFDIAKFHEIEQLGGHQNATRVLAIFKDALEKKIPDLFKNAKLLAVENLLGDDFVVLLEFKKELTLANLQDAAIASRIMIKESLKQDMLKITGEPLEIHVGYAVLNSLSGNLESQFYNAVREAKGIAKGSLDLHTVRLLSEFRSLLDGSLFKVVYQPIISLRWGSILGWEALTRGPTDSYFRNPDIIFSFAEEVGLLFPLEKVCRQIAFNRLGEIGPDQKLFINIHPRTISDPNFVRGETMKLIKEAGLKPINIVFEITERHSIHDFSFFNKTLEHYRNQGFLVAVDDAGAGFSCLQSIAEIRPDFIKIDMSLIRGIHTNAVKRSLMETFVIFAEKIGSTVIAEGIEEEEELETLANLGVHYGQGYYLGYPVFPKQFLNEKVSLKMFRLASNGRNRVWKQAFPVEEIIENAVKINKNTPVRDVKELFDEDVKISGVVVVEKGIPEGLVMRNNLYRYLSMQYGVPLYYKRPISLIMDHLPLILEGDTPIEIASQAAMSRDITKLYDYIVITKDKALHGVVSVQTLLDTMTKIRLETAKGANPLTGLPGNIAIEQELYRLISENIPFNIIYIDLDHFKSYNDRYGFERGDRVILFTSRLLNSVLQRFGGEKSFLSHIGGDDFVIIMEKEQTDEVCNRFLRYFDRLIKSFYDEGDRGKGGILGFNREGKDKLFPFMSVSIAVIQCEEGTTANLKSISEKAAQLKRYAKSISGSIVVKDRRNYEA
jgi:EAL domain-containing protein (putative c-di-GMP-specific phosphodiesterase class I)